MAKTFRLAMVAAILIALSAIATPVEAAGVPLTVNVTVAKLQVYDAPGGTAIFGDYVTGSVEVDAFSVDEQGGIWLRIGNGTQTYHPIIGAAERWIKYGGTRDTSNPLNLPSLMSVYALAKVSWTIEQRAVGTVRMRTVEEPVQIAFADGAGNFAQASGDLSWTTRPQFLTVFRVPARNDLRLYGLGGDCVARVNGVEQTFATTSDLVLNPSDKVMVVGATCGIFSVGGVGLDVSGVKRSFSGTILQANISGLGALLVLMAIVFGLYQAWRKRKFALALQVSIAVLVIGGLALVATAPAYAGPQPPTPTPTGPVATPTATVEGTPEASPTPTPTSTPTAPAEGTPVPTEAPAATEAAPTEIPTEAAPSVDEIVTALLANPEFMAAVEGPAGPEGPKGADAPQFTVYDVANACAASVTCVDAVAKKLLELQAAQATPVVPTAPTEEVPAAPTRMDWLFVGQLCLFGILFLAAVALIVTLIRRRRQPKSPFRPAAKPAKKDDLEVEEAPAKDAPDSPFGETPAAEGTRLRRPGGSGG